MNNSDTHLGRISSNYHKLTVGDVCRYQKSKWLGRIWIKLKFFFLQHKGWVTTKKIKQLVRTLGEDKEEKIKLQTLYNCLGTVKVNQKSKMDDLFTVVKFQVWNKPFVVKDFDNQTIHQLRQYEGCIIKLKVGRYAKEDINQDEQYDNNRRGQQGFLKHKSILGKLIRVSNKPVYVSGRYLVIVDVIDKLAGSVKTNFYMSDSELMRFNPKRRK